MADFGAAQPETLKARLALALDAAEAQAALDGAAAAEKTRAATLRLISCAVRDRDASARTRGDCNGCPDTSVRNVLETMAEQRRVSSAEFDDAGRFADAAREREELAVIKEFLPQPLDGDDLEDAVRDVVTALDAKTLKDLGKIMSELKARYPGKIDSRSAGKAVRRALQ
ncbi:MAG: GatB/YqeY domain-containing protein [Pseudomonadota bacterium]